MCPNSKAVGDTTESKILHTLISNGYSVSIPFGDNDKYDLIVDDDGRLLRIQCKTAWETKTGTIRFNTHSQTTRDGEYHESTYHDAVDAFVVRYPETDDLYWIDVAEATDQKMELRFSAEIDHPAINWASDYEFDGTIPSISSRPDS
ncbi:group I intron-associated PD-(D/E)XK endonuclease [Halobacterium hubeiense]|uniref:group I intron-associated PD-(D/E)XK endonuclease n=1 Tax=Halobacterium hubeiense TaxID=1407499 RepID=UPI000B7E0CDC|nr:group I intron-associated PD-(D/E)XK endonuclease [Halobacterium hubeiense]